MLPSPRRRERSLSRQSGAVGMAMSVWLWRLWKWLTRLVTGKCEIQRFCEAKEPVETRTHNIGAPNMAYLSSIAGLLSVYESASFIIISLCPEQSMRNSRNEVRNLPLFCKTSNCKTVINVLYNSPTGSAIYSHRQCCQCGPGC